LKFKTYKNNKEKRVYGLTGSIATGKSFVSSVFRKLGAEIIDADKLARQVISKDSPVLEKIKLEFGSSSINQDGTLNRVFLRKMIVQDKSLREKLNKITHPAIIELENKLVLASTKKIVIVDAALLIESGSYKRFEKIILTYATPEVQLKRLMARDEISKKEAEKNISMQISIDGKRKFADFIIDNSGSKEDTEQLVVNIYELL